MEEVSAPRRMRLAPLFDGYKWNYLPQAVLEGTLGRALADDETEPRIAVLEADRLRLSIPAGDPRHPLAQAYLAGLRGPWALIFASPGWEELASQCHAGKLVLMPRYAFSSERLDAAHLLLHSLQQGLEPNWDAANQASARLAQRLGYTPRGTHQLVLFAGSRIMAAVTHLGLKIKERVGK